MLESLKTSSVVYNLGFIISLVAWLVGGVGLIAGFRLDELETTETEAKARKAESEQVETVNELRFAKNEAVAAEKIFDQLESQQRTHVQKGGQATLIRTSQISSFPQGSPTAFIVASKMLVPESAQFARLIFKGIPFFDEPYRSAAIRFTQTWGLLFLVAASACKDSLPYLGQ